MELGEDWREEEGEECREKRMGGGERGVQRNWMEGGRER
jgi:hypothetical protein